MNARSAGLLMANETVIGVTFCGERRGIEQAGRQIGHMGKRCRCVSIGIEMNMSLNKECLDK